MLILTRKVKESIMIGDQIKVTVVDVKGNQVKIGIVAPRNVTVHREEIFLMIKEQNIEAAKQTPDSVFNIKKLLNEEWKDVEK